MPGSPGSPDPASGGQAGGAEPPELSTEPTAAQPFPDFPAAVGRRRGWILALGAICTFVTVLDLAVAVVALPSIARAIGSTPNEIQWVVTGYGLTFGMVPIIAGRLGDQLGQRTMLIVGLVGFVGCSALVAGAPGVTLVIVGRLLQGAAGGLLQPQVVGLVHGMFRGRDRASAFALVGVAAAVGAAAGPGIGGLILEVGGPTLGWRFVFLATVPLALTALVLTLVVAPRGRRNTARERLDHIGALLLGTALIGILYPAISLGTAGDGRPARILMLLAAAIVGAVFWIRERRRRRRGIPTLIDAALFRVRSFVNGLLVAGLYSSSYLAVPMLLTLFLQIGLDYSPLAAGLAVMPMAVGAAVSAPFAGRLLRRLGRRLVVLGLGVYTLGITSAVLTAAVLSHSSPESVGWAIAGPLAVAGIGGGWVIHPNQALTLEQVPTWQGSAAGGLIQTGQRIGGALGMAITGTAFSVAVGQYRVDENDGDTSPLAAQGLMAGASMLVITAGAAILVAHRDARLRGSGHHPNR